MDMQHRPAGPTDRQEASSMSGTLTIDTTATFQAVLLMATGPKLKFVSTQQDISAPRDVKWDVHAAGAPCLLRSLGPRSLHAFRRPRPRHVVPVASLPPLCRQGPRAPPLALAASMHRRPPARTRREEPPGRGVLRPGARPALAHVLG